jgi:hypothetical protein
MNARTLLSRPVFPESNKKNQNNFQYGGLRLGVLSQHSPSALASTTPETSLTLRMSSAKNEATPRGSLGPSALVGLVKAVLEQLLPQRVAVDAEPGCRLELHTVAGSEHLGYQFSFHPADHPLKQVGIALRG